MATQQDSTEYTAHPDGDSRTELVEILGVVVTVDELEEALIAIGAYPPALTDASFEND